MSFGMAYATKKRAGKCMAKGGEVKGVHKQHPDRREGTSEAGHYAKYKTSDAGESAPYLKKKAMEHHQKVAGEMKSMPGPTSGVSGFAEGGEVDEMGEYDPVENPQPVDNEAANMEDADMIARIMHKRKMYSKGGVVANEDAPIADAMPAEFDDMEVDDHLEGEQPEDSNEHGDDIGDDPIDRIMMKRKKDKMPRPA